MQMSIESQNELEREKIRALPWGLAHTVLNSIFALWTFMGSAFLLFLSELGLPKGQIGAVLSLFPFCGLLALGFAPIATRLGRKRVFIACYGTRKFVMAGLLLLPVVLAHAGRGAGLALLFGIIVIFAVLRALAETAYYPWSQEFVPNRVRGIFTAWSTVLGTGASCLALLLAGHIIGSGTGLGRYLVLIGAGCVIGVVGVSLMWKIPGGAPAREAADSGAHVAKMRESLRDRNFAAYLAGMGGVTVGSVLLTSFLPLYAKEQLGLSPGTIVRLDAVVMVGGALSSLIWGWLADRFGSRPVLMPSLALSLVIPAAWLLLPRHVPHAAAWCAATVPVAATAPVAALYFAYGVASNGIAIGSGRLLFNGVVPPEKNTAYTAIYYAWLGVTGGVAPLMAGGLLSVSARWQTRLGPLSVDGYSLLFLLALVLLAVGGWQYGRVRPDDVHSSRAVLARAVNRIRGMMPG